MKRMSKWVSALLALMLLAGLSMPVAMAADLYYETKEKAVIYKGAGTSFGEVVTVPKGDVMVMTSKWYAEWWKVKYTSAASKTYEGYIRSKVLKESSKRSNKKENTENTKPLGCYSTTAELHLRSGPGSSYKSRTTVPKGNVVNVTDTTNASWFKVTFINSKGTKFADGFLASSYLKKASEPYNASAKTQVRKKASKSGKVVCNLPKGAYVLVTAYTNKTWYKVSYTDKNGTNYTGFVLKSKLKKGVVTNKPYTQVDPDANSKKQAELWRTKTRYQVTSASKLLKTAKKKGKKVTNVPKNAVVAVTGSSGKYYKVLYSDAKNKKYEGYLLKSVCKKYADPNVGTYVTTVATQLRSSDSSTGAVMAELPAYTLFQVLDSFEKSWYRVSYTNENGTNQVGFLLKGHADKYNETKAGSYYTVVATALRKGASDTAEVAYELPQGALVDVSMTYNPDWYVATYTDENSQAVSGFVYSGHLGQFKSESLEYVATAPTFLRKLPSQTGSVVSNVAAEQAVIVRDAPFIDWYWATVTDAGGNQVNGYLYAPHMKTKEQYEAEKKAQEQQNQQNQEQQNQEQQNQQNQEQQNQQNQQNQNQAQSVEAESAEEDNSVDQAAAEEAPAEESVAQEERTEEEVPQVQETAEEEPVAEESAA